MESVIAYIPMDRCLALVQGTKLPERTRGTALFADISGFTPLTEALARLLGPRRGAEELTRQLNLVYDALIAEIHRYGGCVLSFAGDAITCWFDESVVPGPLSLAPTDTSDLPHQEQRTTDNGQVTALRAAASALALQQVMARFAAIPLPDGSAAVLALKVSVGSGPARRFVVGDPGIQLIDALAGETLDRVAVADHQTQKGEVVVDAPTVVALGEAAQIVEWRVDHESGERFALLGGLTVAVEPAPWPELADETLAAERVRPWLLPLVYERLAVGLGEFLTELRPATALFVRFTGIDYDRDADAGARLDTYIRWAQGILARYTGSLLQLTIGDKGSYFYAAFGAPIAHEDDSHRAVAAALELRALAPELDFISPVRVGISQGSMRTGAYGGATRRTYGVLGDDVNLAARLMQNAGAGQVLVSQAAQKPTADAFIWESPPPLPVKGKSKPITVFRLLAPRERRAARLLEPRYELPMVGRAPELALAEQKLDLTLRGQGQIIAITAEAGMGKSRLVAEIIRLANARQLAGYIGECQSYGTNNSYLVWQSILRAFFAVDSVDALDEQVHVLEAQIAAIDPALLPRLPLLGVALNLPIPDNELTRSLDAKLRKESLEALLVDCVRARARTTPLMLVLEDCHWIDTLSHDLIEVIGRAVADLPVLIVVAYRPPDLGRLQALRVTQLANCTAIGLTDITPEEARLLIEFKLVQFGGSGEELPATLAEQIMGRAQGNPFYIEELLNYLRDQELDLHDIEALERLELPTSLHSLILSRIDKLTESQKSMLKVASVIGRLFPAAMLWGAYPQLGDPGRVKADLDVLTRHDLTSLDTPEPELIYLFRHVLTQEVAYESLPFATRAVLHDQIGQYIERAYHTNLDQYIDLLAYHYDHSENEAKRREYLRRAGVAAQAAYANEAAIDYYQRLLPLLVDSEARQQIFARLGEILAVTAQYEPALEHLQEALGLAVTLGDLDAQARACRWISYIHEFRSEFAQALEWIQRGLEALGDRETAARAQLLAIAGLIHTRQGNYDQALDLCENAIRIAEHLGDTTSLAFACNSRAIVFRRHGDYGTAIEYFLKAAELYERAENIHGQAMSYNGIANTYSDIGSWTAASDYARRAREIFVQTGDELHRVFVDNNLGEIARNQGRLDDALTFYQDALHSMEQMGGAPYVIGALHINLGATFVRRGEIDSARLHLRISQESLARVQSRDYLPALHLYLAEAALQVSELDEAEAEGQLALDLARELAMRGEEGSILRVLGEIALARRDLAQAEAYLLESLAVLDEVGHEYEAARSRLSLAEVYLAQRRAEAGLAEIERCARVFQRLDAALDLAATRELREKLTRSV